MTDFVSRQKWIWENASPREGKKGDELLLSDIIFFPQSVNLKIGNKIMCFQNRLTVKGHRTVGCERTSELHQLEASQKGAALENLLLDGLQIN